MPTKYTTTGRTRIHYVDSDRSIAGLKGAINNPYVSWRGASRARADLKAQRVPRSEIPHRKIGTVIERLGIKLGLKHKRHHHRHHRI